jgi:hypothetical protein
LVTCGNTIFGEAILSFRVADTWQMVLHGQVCGEDPDTCRWALTMSLTAWSIGDPEKS